MHDLTNLVLSKNTGYYWASYPNHPNAYKCGRVLFHRLVMENYLGRYLTSEEIVHHRDENRLNNDISNLELTNRSEHAKYHNTKFNVSDEDIIDLIDKKISSRKIAKQLGMSLSTFYEKSHKYRKDNGIIKKRVYHNYMCKMCGKEFKATHKNRIYCSYECSHISYHKITWPPKEELEKLVWEKPTIQLAKQFGVSDKAIEKWCKKYNINKPPRGYWQKQKSIK